MKFSLTILKVAIFIGGKNKKPIRQLSDEKTRVIGGIFRAHFVVRDLDFVSSDVTTPKGAVF